MPPCRYTFPVPIPAKYEFLPLELDAKVRRSGLRRDGASTLIRADTLWTCPDRTASCTCRPQSSSPEP